MNIRVIICSVLLFAGTTFYGELQSSLKEIVDEIETQEASIIDLSPNDMPLDTLYRLFFLCTEAFVVTSDQNGKKKYRKDAIKYLDYISRVERKVAQADTISCRTENGRAARAKAPPPPPSSRRASGGDTVGKLWSNILGRRSEVSQTYDSMKTYAVDYDLILRLGDMDEKEFCMEAMNIFNKRGFVLEKALANYSAQNAEEEAVLSGMHAQSMRAYDSALDMCLITFEFEKGLNDRLDFAKRLLIDSYIKSSRKEEAKAFFGEMIKIYPQEKIFTESLNIVENEDNTGLTSL